MRGPTWKTHTSPPHLPQTHPSSCIVDGESPRLGRSENTMVRPHPPNRKPKGVCLTLRVPCFCWLKGPPKGQPPILRAKTRHPQRVRVQINCLSQGSWNQVTTASDQLRTKTHVAGKWRHCCYLALILLAYQEFHHPIAQLPWRINFIVD